MSRRRGAPWAATSVPDVRRQWCAALDLTVERHAAGLEPEPGRGSAEGLRARRLQDKLAAALEVMRTESQALGRAELYWASRDMVDVAVDASAGLPEWTPGLAAPCPNGLLCWAKPAGVVPYGPPGQPITELAWDGVWWWTRPDGRLQLIPASRFVGHAGLLAPYEVSTPLWAASTVLVDPDRPRTEETDGTGDVQPFVRVVGAAWLLMGQPNVAETRVLEEARSPREPSGLPPGPNLRITPRVTLIDLRRPARAPRDPPEETEGRRGFSRRWWVGGHWRQQACGVDRAQRRPVWIAPYVKGPIGAPLATDRVFVWRR